MRVIVAGSRDITDYNLVQAAIRMSGFNMTELVSGGARGVDQLGEMYADRNNIPIKPFPALWKKFGRSAGHIRNAEMGDYAEGLVAIWDGITTGTQGMIKYATKQGLYVYTHYEIGEEQ